ncbi:MAG: hypothetical protein JXR70_07775 [Spirochaetales bacterium]|nr:hypothetical protein [Spirochaetales bacterium]
MKKSLTQDDIIYFIVTDRFFGSHKTSAEPSDNSIHQGTLDGIIDKLDYLAELGVTAIWVTPVYENIDKAGSSEPYHYYWPKDFTRLDKRQIEGRHLPSSTDMKSFRKFVELCEKRGFKVVLDMVVNHCGYGAQSNFPDTWFNHNGQGDIKGELARLPDFNHDNPEVVDYFINNIQDWIIKGGVTNIRMDTVKHVEPRFWHFFKSQIRGEYPDVYLIGEVLLEGREHIPELLKYQNYHDFDSLFDFPLCSALRSCFIYDQSLKNNLARPRLHDNEESGVLDNDNPFYGGYRNSNQLVTLLDNHDLQQRIMSHARSKHQGKGAGLDWAIRVVKLALGAMFTFRGIPQLYYGTEIGLEGWKKEDDRDLRRDFPWDMIGADQHPVDDPPYHKAREIYHWTRDLIALRKSSAPLKYGTSFTLWSDDLVYIFLRISIDEVALVSIHNGYERMPESITLDLNRYSLSTRVKDLLRQGLEHWKKNQPLNISNNLIHIRMEAKSIDIYIS